MKVCLLVCSYNGSAVIGETLRHICNVQPPTGHEWELIVVDNASTDGTAATASRYLNDAPFPCRVLSQPLPGKMNALRMGIHTTQAELISIIDDDNWISADWLETVIARADAHPKVGIFGSLNEAVCESSPPEWFSRFKGRYACGPQNPGKVNANGECTFGVIFGAGMTFRKSIWTDLEASDFWFMNDCGPNRFQTSGEDMEFCYAACQLGWHVMYCPELTLKHFMTTPRLNWQYLLRLMKANGHGVVGIDPHIIVKDQSVQPKRMDRLRQTWQWQLIARLRRLTRHPPAKLLFPNRIPEGDASAMSVIGDCAAVRSILRERGRYTKYFRQVAALAATWRK